MPCSTRSSAPRKARPANQSAMACEVEPGNATPLPGRQCREACKQGTVKRPDYCVGHRARAGGSRLARFRDTHGAPAKKLAGVLKLTVRGKQA